MNMTLIDDAYTCFEHPLQYHLCNERVFLVSDLCYHDVFLPL